MDTRMPGAGKLTADRGDWRMIWARDGLTRPVAPTTSPPTGSGARSDGDGRARPWFPDYEEIE